MTMSIRELLLSSRNNTLSGGLRDLEDHPAQNPDQQPKVATQHRDVDNLVEFFVDVRGTVVRPGFPVLCLHSRHECADLVLCLSGPASHPRGRIDVQLSQRTEDEKAEQPAHGSSESIPDANSWMRNWVSHFFTFFVLDVSIKLVGG